MPENSICGLTDSVRVGPLPDPDPDPTLAPDSALISISSSAAAAADEDPVSAWLDGNLNPSVVYERHDSAKETTNPKSNNNPNPKNSRSKSQRFSSSSAAGGAGGTNLKAEGPIFGLPARIRHVSCSVSRRPPPPSTSGRIFPKKKKPIESEPEPTSPKVSCFGKVSSDRERTTTTTKDPDPDRKPGCFACFFPCGGGRRPKLLEEEDDYVTGMKSSTHLNKSVISVEETTTAVAPGLGGMKRFSSGRRPASWGGEGDDDFGIDRESVFGRRSFDRMCGGTTQRLTEQ